MKTWVRFEVARLVNTKAEAIAKLPELAVAIDEPAREAGKTVVMQLTVSALTRRLK